MHSPPSVRRPPSALLAEALCVGCDTPIWQALEASDFFGEAVLLGDFRRKMSVCARSYTECVVLSDDDFLTATADYPEMKEKVSQG
jgi:hypothetical protein